MKKYNLIYADPPWTYPRATTGRGGRSGSGNKYSIMTFQEICEMPVKDLCHDDAVVFIWATVPLLGQGIDLIKAWGFEYRGLIVWEKTGHGMGLGAWVRIQVEFILFGIKGKVKPFMLQEPNIYKKKTSGHSKKPHFFRELVSKMGKNSFGDDLKKLELFARSREGMFSDYEYEDGWDVFGNQVNNSINIKT